jgi:hypothetical protein
MKIEKFKMQNAKSPNQVSALERPFRLPFALAVMSDCAMILQSCSHSSTKAVIRDAFINSAFIVNRNQPRAFPQFFQCNIELVNEICAAFTRTALVAVWPLRYHSARVDQHRAGRAGSQEARQQPCPRALQSPKPFR